MMRPSLEDMMDAVERRGWAWLLRTDTTTNGFLAHLMSPQFDATYDGPHFVAYGGTREDAFFAAFQDMQRSAP